jgi:peptidoglycan/xylan/chitin deacetylase (PgdA/CDA1 family)
MKRIRPALAVCLAGKVVTLATLFSHRGIAATAFFGGDLFVLYHMLVPTAQGLGPVCSSFVTDRRETWLTIDDGPDATDTPQILAALARHQARATFFLIGERAERHPELVAEILRQGHEVAHHTYTHPVASFWCATPRRVAAELDRGLAALRLGGAQPRRFRAPVGIKSPFLQPALVARGLACVAWSVRSHDSFDPKPERIVARVMRRMRPGATILMHEGPRVPLTVRVTAINGVLSALTAEGYRCILPDAAALR